MITCFYGGFSELSRTKLILIACVLVNVGAHSEPLPDLQSSVLTHSRDIASTKTFAANVNVIATDDVYASAFISDEYSNSRPLVSVQRSESNSPAGTPGNPATSELASNERADMWLLVLATMGLITWQLWRKQKSLRFAQSWLAKEADYAVRQ